MNNRLVLQLREKAYKKASARAISAPYEMKNSEFDTMFQEMFVELIVRECAEVAGETRWAVPPTQEQIASSIRQHFGVEE